MSVGGLGHTYRLVVSDPKAALASPAVSPESIKRWRGAGHAVVSEQEPEAEDRLGKNIKNSVGNDFDIQTNKTATIGDTPDNWVGGPENEGESGQSTEESLGLTILASSSTSAIDDDLVDNDEVGNASPGVPSPLLALGVAVSSEETGQDHDDISDDGDQDVGTAETGQKAQVEEKKRCSDGPVNVSCPVDLASGDLLSVWKSVLVADGLSDLVEVDTITDGHSKVGQEGESGDEGSQDVEESLVSCDSECHSVESQRGQCHDHTDNPEGSVTSVTGGDIVNRWLWHHSWDWSDRRGGLHHGLVVDDHIYYAGENANYTTALRDAVF